MPTVTVRPTGNGAIIQNQPYPSSLQNWECVDETTPNDATDYVVSPSSVGDFTDLYQKEQSGIPSTAIINSVTLYIRIRTPATSSGYQGLVKGALRNQQGSIYLSSAFSSQLWTTEQIQLNTSPFTGQPWAVSEVENLQIGVQTTTVYDPDSGVYGRGYCSTVWLVIDYSTPTVIEATDEGLGEELFETLACIEIIEEAEGSEELYTQTEVVGEDLGKLTDLIQVTDVTTKEMEKFLGEILNLTSIMMTIGIINLIMRIMEEMRYKR